MGGIPNPRITQYDLGNKNGEFPMTVTLLANELCQIRHNALEAARIAANRLLERELERKNYMLKIIPYPHQVLREHKRINVAQADRFQEGMRRAYGRPVGTAARVERGDTILVAEVQEEGVDVAKEALTRAGHKLPIPCKTMVKEAN